MDWQIWRVFSDLVTFVLDGLYLHGTYDIYTLQLQVVWARWAKRVTLMWRARKMFLILQWRQLQQQSKTGLKSTHQRSVEFHNTVPSRKRAHYRISAHTHFGLNFLHPYVATVEHTCAITISECGDTNTGPPPILGCMSGVPCPWALFRKGVCLFIVVHAVSTLYVYMHVHICVNVYVQYCVNVCVRATWYACASWLKNLPPLSLSAHLWIIGCN